jgi:hypothetical protein
VPSVQGQEEKRRITFDCIAQFIERALKADPAAFLELCNLEETNRGHGNSHPTRLGTTEEATGLSAEGLLSAAQVEDQGRRVENGAGLKHDGDEESAANAGCDVRG